LFHEFADLRSDSTNSSFDYIGAILEIRKEFLEGNREFAAGDFLGGCRSGYDAGFFAVWER
jgi:hypothetical protein